MGSTSKQGMGQRSSRWRRLAALLALPILGVAGCGATEAGSEPSFPVKPIRIVVYTGPGGLIDVTARRFAAAAARYTDATFVVENKPGAGGLVALAETLRAPADGYTLFAGTGSTIAKLVETGRTETLGELDWVAQLMADPECLIVRRSGPVPSWEELVADARTRPGQQLWVGPAAGGLDHVMAMKVWERAGLSGRWIPYRSGGKAVAALLGGHGAVYVGNPGEVLGNPELKVVAVSSLERLPAFPDAPTFRELGVSGLDSEVMWRGFALRKETPAGPRAWYASLFEQVSADPGWRSFWERSGIDAEYGGPELLGGRVQREREQLEHYLGQLGGDEDGERALAALGEGPLGGGLIVLLVVLGLAAWWVLGRRRGSLGGVAVPLVLLAVGAVLGLATFAFPGGAEGAGPEAMPRLWLVLLLPVAAALLVQELRSCTAAPEQAVEAPCAREDSSPLELPSISPRGPLLLSALVGYVLMLWVFGYFVASGLFLTGALVLLGERRAPVWAAVAGGWLGLSWLVFSFTLDVPLPRGALLQLLTGG